MRNISSRAAAMTALMTFVLSLPATAFATSGVPAGTEVPLTFVAGVSSKTAQEGDPIAFRVARDVVADGRVAIPEGARAEGVVEKVHRGRTFGRKGELKIRLVRVQDLQGEYLPLESYKTGNRVAPGGPAASGAGLLVLGPLGLAAGAFVRGRDITIKPGTLIQAQVAG